MNVSADSDVEISGLTQMHETHDGPTEKEEAIRRAAISL